MLQDQTSSDQLCPCESGKPFNFCCAPAINGSRPAKSAEALMRSRYSAFLSVQLIILSTPLHQKLVVKKIANYWWNKHRLPTGPN